MIARPWGNLRDLAKPGPETTVGLRLTDRGSGARLAFAPALGALDSVTLAELAAADLRFVDGTFFTQGALAMGHVPITGADGSLGRLASLPGRTLYLHMNATNPILDPDSPEAARVRATGVGIAEDGMKVRGVGARPGASGSAAVEADVPIDRWSVLGVV